MAGYFGLVPAAGTGARMGEALPKQYLKIGERPLLWYALRCLCTHPRVRRTFVVLHPKDRLFPACDWSHFGDALVPLFCGGATRAQSVMLGLERMRGQLQADDWVLVHDAARPCLTAVLIDRLIVELSHCDDGGLLAIPAADTLKRADGDGRVLYTESRDELWQAQTPQMFRFGPLLAALRAADPARITDEAGAIEQLGHRPRLVMGSAANIKVTYPEDLTLAALILKGQLP
ncbi:MAG TPA: 2-C-methyl-D-erythritol 4-phosphate cytidylyltransferase [Burkholderiales bacterium]|nr:2-C-methyl-D-erythritol 4-phosphate cytidylyltransferase [Burkholderiales bacterium]